MFKRENDTLNLMYFQKVSKNLNLKTNPLYPILLL